MSILLATQTANRNLRGDTVLSYMMLADGDVRINLYAGTLAKPCVALAGTWQLFYRVISSYGGGTSYWIEPFPQLYAASDNLYKLFVSKVIELKASDTVSVILFSPNGGDTDVAVSAEIWHVSGSLPALVPGAVGGLPVLDANSRIAANLQAVLGTLLTEGAAGRLAAAIIKLFDVAVPVLVASDVMRGTNGAYTGTPPTVEQIQSGLATGGNVTAATAAIAALFEVIKGAGWLAGTDTLEKIAAAIAGVGGAVGPGASPTTIEWLDADSGLPVADGDVWVSTDAAGANVIAGTLQTNSLGKATFMLDTGVTYYLWGQKDGYAPIEGESFIAE